ncbi:hypothetical protein KP509_31G028500 [Ceratopteris richardii]|uniref:Uncharacterized protein n=1 Tax=Ceratopteris richardii TaxID=49495 RepID=A0A8T2QXB1_CERRI|nr:hypothetical protein KP509_31G028500 [Ceratopteris richardii]
MQEKVGVGRCAVTAELKKTSTAAHFSSLEAVACRSLQSRLLSLDNRRGTWTSVSPYLCLQGYA